MTLDPLPYTKRKETEKDRIACFRNVKKLRMVTFSFSDRASWFNDYYR